MRLVILGAAESGIGAAILAQQQGMDVFVSDRGSIKPRYKEMLDAAMIPWEEGGHTEALVLNADEVVKSPGIPETAPMVAILRRQGTPVVSEIEFACRYTRSRLICITGSNGKTTTTSLVYHIMKKAGEDVGLGGNIGRSFALQVAREPKSVYVLEISSFQLDDIRLFRPDVAVLLNITPDHLDRYQFEMQRYVDSKMRITENQTAEDTFIYWAQDEYIPSELSRRHSGAQCLAFSDVPQSGAASWITPDGMLRIESPQTFSIAVNELSLPGRHNLRNCAAAAMACLAAGVDEAAVREGLKDFPGVEHRLEKAGIRGGVAYVNDSKATNVDACFCALDSMTTPVVLILGGLDKGNDYAQILPLVKEKCRALVYLGADNAKLHRSFDALGLPVADTASMADCVAACARLAQPGDTVLLSPCCASFDLFNNMEDRGCQFKVRVSELPE